MLKIFAASTISGISMVLLEFFAGNFFHIYIEVVCLSDRHTSNLCIYRIYTITITLNFKAK
ncbi:MAG: hypothetical protein A2W71_00090 [Candidatus Nealsonbacteria bacterium RIFCSPLOWO2_02_39_8]|uniref:Uncharacterized protein n=1 Tax=Candidatus Nealsonbacteria bacterium RIFCSPLOWO2_02_39_8 TaxID=1801674 RepID=A0A1G2EGK9_9BACT|nr:MAG: hypothetical protein A2W71_00090 [Candidatus Nealsonbacteria bacterium RIFCSPLOWO2_02_39_8]